MPSPSPLKLSSYSSSTKYAKPLKGNWNSNALGGLPAGLGVGAGVGAAVLGAAGFGQKEIYTPSPPPFTKQQLAKLSAAVPSKTKATNASLKPKGIPTTGQGPTPGVPNLLSEMPVPETGKDYNYSFEGTSFTVPSLTAPVAVIDTGLEASAPAKTHTIAVPPPLPVESKAARQLEDQVRHRLEHLGTKRKGKVDPKLLPLLERLDLDPVEFFTARACWQGADGTGKKRRPILEAVLQEFPKLPKDEKNWEAALDKVRDSGREVSRADEHFVGYFFENRGKLKSLMRATLPRAWRSQRYVTVYRGQSNSDKYGEDSTRPLGCYTLSPGVARSFSDGNLKKYSVRIDEVWSTSFATQNNYGTEEELTVLSLGGMRRGERVEDLDAEKAAYQAAKGLK